MTADTLFLGGPLDGERRTVSASPGDAIGIPSARGLPAGMTVLPENSARHAPRNGEAALDFYQFDEDAGAFFARYLGTSLVTATRRR